HRLWRDFQGYTVFRGADTVALGVSAISSIGGAYAQNHKIMRDYEDALAAGRLPTERGIVLTGEDRARAEVITEIMCNFRVDLARFPLDFAAERAALLPLVADGVVALEGSEVRVTLLGR